MNSITPMVYVIGFSLSLFLSWILTGLLRRIALHVGLTDKPDGGRKSQKQPIPYLGGIGIILSFLLVLFFGLLYQEVTRETLIDVIYLVLPATILGFIGLWDDVKNLSPQFRLMIQVIMGLAGSLTITFGSTSGSATSNRSLDLLLSIFWIVGITNAINFFDNMDGGAAVATFMTSIGMMIYGILTNQPYISGFSALLMGSLVGFFLWNRRPARIYMGDAGALFLGILLATIVIRIDPATDSKITSLALPILFLALPILDTSVVVISRILRGQSPLQGGQDHLSHRLALKGIRHRYILYIFALVAMIFQLPIFVSLFLGVTGELLTLGLSALLFLFAFVGFYRLPIVHVRK
jgi:UDP-GlcNAc:undecaprenyl-phosphate GlcNAc-1-phosphate transferase